MFMFGWGLHGLSIRNHHFPSHMLLSPYYDPIYDMHICFKEIHPTVPNCSLSLILSLLAGAVTMSILGHLFPFNLRLAPDGRTASVYKGWHDLEPPSPLSHHQ